jgi:hypothetical protein
MAWHLNLGIDEGFLQKADAKDKSRQKFIYSMIVIMLLVVSGLISISAVTYMLIIFNNWLLAIASGLILCIIVFNLYRLLLVTAINAEKTSLGRYQLNHELQYDDFFDNNKSEEMAVMPDEQILKIVNVRKDSLRESSSGNIGKSFNFSQLFFTNLFRVFILIVIAMVFSTGLQLLIFKNHINDVLNSVSTILSKESPESWLLQNVLTPNKGGGFILINSSSLLLCVQLLVKGLGFWKIILDFLFLLLVLLPLILILKSREVQNGSYVQELALHEISISFTHYLQTQKYCAGLLKKNLSKEFINKLK